MTSIAANWYSQPAARNWRSRSPRANARPFHESFPQYEQSRLVELPTLALELGVAHVVLKEECARLGLPAFKILGASYAISRALSPGEEALPLSQLRELISDSPVSIVAATDGNHGRAVAHVAGLLGLPSRIFVPTSITPQAQQAIEEEGAQLVVLDIPYDDVVQHAIRVAEELGSNGLLVQDSAWPGYEQIPGWIVDGYSTLFAEADEQLRAAGLPPASLVTVPTGVGALAVAAVDRYRRDSRGPVILVIEPDTAPAVLASLLAGEPVAVPTGRTIMNGLNCGVVSPGAWQPIRDGVDAAITVTDDEARQAVRDLRSLGVDSGPCGASSLAGVRALCRDDAKRAQSGIDGTSVLLLLSTEGLEANPIEL